MINVTVDISGKRVKEQTQFTKALVELLESKGFDVTYTDGFTLAVVGDDQAIGNLTPALVQEEAYSKPISALAEAHKIVHGDREQTYGDAGKNFRTIAAYWNTHLLAAKSIEARLTEEDVCGMMILLKQARLANSPGHRDSLVDIAGYTELNDIIQQQKVKS